MSRNVEEDDDISCFSCFRKSRSGNKASKEKHHQEVVDESATKTNRTGFCAFKKTSQCDDPRSWQESFDKLILSAAGREQFSKFLKDEYAAENLKFWEECETFKNETDKERLLVRANEIFETYVKTLSPDEVNLPSEIVNHIKMQLNRPSPNLFKDAQKYVYSMMQQENYPRFLGSNYYKSLI